MAILALQRNDFSAGAAYVRVNVERFPEMVDARRPWLSSDVEQDADVGLEDRSEGVEEPSVGVDLIIGEWAGYGWGGEDRPS